MTYAEHKKIQLDELKKLESPMNLICVTHVKMEVLFSEFKKMGIQVVRRLNFSKMWSLL